MQTIKQPPILGIVVPCFNEEEVLQETFKRLSQVRSELIEQLLISESSKIIFVDDGSKDKTWRITEQLCETHSYLHGLKLSRNVGHQNALLAGLHLAGEFADCVVSIDADLQDDVNAIKQFILKFHEGFDIVYGVRAKRNTDTFFKRNTALGFYKLMKTMGVNIVHNHADYRLLSKKALDELVRYNEVNMFLRGIVPLLGFKSTEVFYDRQERFAGESKYPLKKMLSFAIDGITSFSVTPIRLVSSAGFIIFFLSIIAAIYAVIEKFFGQTVSGWTSLIVSIWFIGGVQLICLGLIGEYIGKMYKETKQRPKYIIEKNLHIASPYSLNQLNREHALQK